MHSSPFNMRQFNLSVMKPPVSKSAAASGTSKASMSYTVSNNAAKALDLLRENIQKNINMEIHDVMTKYMDRFVKPGIENIRNNLGPDAVTDEHIKNMCRQILEEAKILYPYPNAPPAPRSNSLGGVDPANNDAVQQFTPPPMQQQSQPLNQNHQPNASDVKLPMTSPSFGIKRESDTDSEASCMSNASKKAKKSSNKANNGNSSATGNAGEGVNKKNNSSNDNANASPSKPKKPSGPFRKHVAMWDSNKLTIETMFIMGAKANKALGFAQTRGRLYVKHPGLFKYASDSDDKEWLSKNKLMPATGGRAYIMLLEDIEKLAKDNTLNVAINYEDIKGFKVPDFILDKMKNYINNWKKTYAEEDEKNAALQRTRNINANKPTISTAPPLSLPQTTHANTMNSIPHTVTNHLNNNVIVSNAVPINNAPPLPPPPPTSIPPPHPQQQQQLQQQQHPNHVTQQPQSLNNFITGNSTNVLYDTSSFSASQPHEMADYMLDVKPPPMYPGQPPQQQQQQHQMQGMNNPGVNYLHSNQLDPIEQAISKGDWSQVSDRSLLQYALQSTRSIGSCGSWDPQDSFDLIESVTNGGLGGGSGVVGGSGGLGETSPLLQISPNAGAHLAQPPLGPVSPNCELSAVLDQVSAFQYTET